MKKNGITLVALVITIIIMIILAGVTIGLLFSEDGIIERTKEAKFKSSLEEVKEQVLLYWHDKETDAIINLTNLSVIEKLPVSTQADSSKFSQTLEDEIKTQRGIDDISILEFYTIDNTKIKYSSTHTFIIDTGNLQIYDVEGEVFKGKIHHTLNSSGVDISSSSGSGSVTTEASIEESGDIGWLKPNLTGFNSEYTKIVYYNEADKQEMMEVSVQEYINGGRKSIIENDGKTFRFDAYAEENKMWANIRVEANGLESWWVWIPRYAYKVNGSSSTPKIDVVFIDMDNNPIGTKYEGKYTVNNDGTITINESTYYIQPGFTVKEADGTVVKELQGIWMSKYEPGLVRNNTTVPESGDCLPPNLDEFDENNTYVIYWSADLSKKHEVLLSTYNSTGKQRTITYEDETYTFYDYQNKIWANVKTNANSSECWWVWQPRYAYCISAGTKEVEVIFVGMDNKPVNKSKYGNTLKNDMIVHPGFTVKEADGTVVKELQGIWMSKYEPYWE